jgi:hypothetical protein
MKLSKVFTGRDVGACIYLWEVFKEYLTECLKVRHSENSKAEAAPAPIPPTEQTCSPVNVVTTTRWLPLSAMNSLFPSSCTASLPGKRSAVSPAALGLSLSSAFTMRNDKYISKIKYTLKKHSQYYRSF